MNNNLIYSYLVLTFNLFAQSNVFITDIDDLKYAINSASPGDTITVKNGSHDSEGSITITNSGEEGNPIIIKAEEVGEVELRGESYFDFRQCEYMTLEGFNFTSKNVTAVKLQASNNIRISRNRFAIQETESVKWILIGGIWNDANALSHHNRIDHNIFENKSYPGNFITIDGSSDPTYISSQYDRIDHNHFRMNTPRAENEKESIRVGWSELSKSSGYTIVEYNLFEDCDGDPEIISVKTCDNTIRYNTFVRCAGTLSLRHGNRSSVYGNYFLGEAKSGTGGVRVYGDDHKIYNNYFEGLMGTKWDAPLTLTNGDYDGGSNLTKHFRINRAIIVHNTLINNSHNIEIGYTNNGKYSKPPREVTIADNIVVARENEIVKIISEPIDFEWENNVFYPTEGAIIGTELDSIAFLDEDPQLQKSVFYKQTDKSPSIDKATNKYEFVITDQEGQYRDLFADIGADEFSTDTIKYLPLTQNDVGPFSNSRITTISKNNSAKPDIFLLNQNFPNPFNPRTIIKYSVPLRKENIASQIKIMIYDVLGRNVKILVNKTQSAGNYEVSLDANDWPSGTYFYQLQAEDNIETKKMILIR